VGTAIASALMVWGAWERRWIADDGLIVLRTVRNLLAGNGPVFNAGERVEANTSTVWTYLVYAATWLTGQRMEYVVLGLEFFLSAASIALAMWGAATIFRRPGARGVVLLLPAGVLVYMAVPPARDFATSGLETSLVLAWLALLWLLMAKWARAERPSAGFIAALCFVAGLGPLVRPEEAIPAVIALAMVFLAPGSSWRLRVGMVASAAIVPVGYQIFRMGYYGLPYPNTAVSKDAGGAKWGQGFTYLWNLVGPYWLWLPAALLLAAGIVAALRLRAGRAAAAAPRFGGNRKLNLAWLRRPSSVVGFMLVSGLILGIYSIRVGGDFMHGRVLLPMLFCLLAPVAVLPIALPSGKRGGAGALAWASSAAIAVLWAGTAAWAVTIAAQPQSADASVVPPSGIVDERAFYVRGTGHEHPITAEDYLDYPRMRGMVRTIRDNPNGGLLLPAGDHDYWVLVPPPLPIPEGGAGHTVFFLNLGMTSMNVPLDVRVLDQMGLAYPLAAHTERMEDGRIGHDKNLYPDWVIADTGMVGRHPWMPAFMNEEWVVGAEVAISCPETQWLLTSYRSELTPRRFVQNFIGSVKLAGYRFDRVPKYEIQRCQLPSPFE
jgi:arabinofuranosyltransferase